MITKLIAETRSVNNLQKYPQNLVSEQPPKTMLEHK